MRKLSIIVICAVLVVVAMMTTVIITGHRDTSQEVIDVQEVRFATTPKSGIEDNDASRPEKKRHAPTADVDTGGKERPQKENRKKPIAMPSKAEKIKRFGKVAKYLDEYVANEPIDAIWSTEAIQNVKSTLKMQGIGNPKLVSVDCRSRMCKVELEFVGTNKKMKFLEKYGNDIRPWGNRGWVWGKSAESAELVVYFAKDGETMPRLPRDL